MERIRCNTSVAILLATYNGDKYLAEQLDSLLNQTYSDLTIYIHDDGSKDNTQAIISEYTKKYPNITQLEYEPCGGSMNNFLSILARVEAPYYFFSDQDDVWLPEKVEVCVKALKEAEEKNGTNTPAVANTDLFITDENLRITDQSFWKVAGIYPQFLRNFNEAAAANGCTGCAMSFNNAARKSVVPHNGKATMHDSWVCLCALKAGGVMCPISKPLIYYRQHSSNALGAATPVNTLTFSYRMAHIKKMYLMIKHHYQMLCQLNYGSFLKFMYYKAKYKQNIKKFNKTVKG